MGGWQVRTTETETLEATLLTVLEMVNDWLKFAEAKNAGAVGAAVGGCAVLSASLTSDKRPPVPTPAALGLGLGGACLVLALLLALLALLPQTRPQTLLARLLAGRQGPPPGRGNLYYYGDLARYTPRALAQALAARHGEVPVGDGHLDLAAQIVVNSRITVAKLRLFSLAVGCLAGAVLAVALALVAMVVCARLACSVPAG